MYPVDFSEANDKGEYRMEVKGRKGSMDIYTTDYGSVDEYIYLFEDVLGRLYECKKNPDDGGPYRFKAA